MGKPEQQPPISRRDALRKGLAYGLGLTAAAAALAGGDMVGANIVENRSSKLEHDKLLEDADRLIGNCHKYADAFNQAADEKKGFFLALFIVNLEKLRKLELDGPKIHRLYNTSDYNNPKYVEECSQSMTKRLQTLDEKTTPIMEYAQKFYPDELNSRGQIESNSKNSIIDPYAHREQEQL